jgi:hypothetical protein
MRIKKGDRVRITIPGHFNHGFYVGPGSCEGTVLSADNWNSGGTKPDNWYIELEKDKASGYGWRTGYGYWKQGEDGGTVEKLS